MKRRLLVVVPAFVVLLVSMVALGSNDVLLDALLQRLGSEALPPAFPSLWIRHSLTSIERI